MLDSSSAAFRTQPQRAAAAAAPLRRPAAGLRAASRSLRWRSCVCRARRWGAQAGGAGTAAALLRAHEGTVVWTIQFTLSCSSCKCEPTGPADVCQTAQLYTIPCTLAAVPQAALAAESREAFRLRRLALVAGSVWCALAVDDLPFVLLATCSKLRPMSSCMASKCHWMGRDKRCHLALLACLCLQSVLTATEFATQTPFANAPPPCPPTHPLQPPSQRIPGPQGAAGRPTARALLPRQRGAAGPRRGRQGGPGAALRG